MQLFCQFYKSYKKCQHLLNPNITDITKFSRQRQAHRQILFHRDLNLCLYSHAVIFQCDQYCIFLTDGCYRSLHTIFIILKPLIPGCPFRFKSRFCLQCSGTGIPSISIRTDHRILIIQNTVYQFVKCREYNYQWSVPVLFRLLVTNGIKGDTNRLFRDLNSVRMCGPPAKAVQIRYITCLCLCIILGQLYRFDGRFLYCFVFQADP